MPGIEPGAPVPKTGARPSSYIAMVVERRIELRISCARGMRLPTRLLHDLGCDIGVEPTLRDSQSRVQSRYTNRTVGSGGWTRTTIL